MRVREREREIETIRQTDRSYRDSKRGVVVIQTDGKEGMEGDKEERETQ